MGSSLPTIDSSAIDVLRETEILDELIDVFLRDAPERVAEVRRALELDEPAGLTEAAHSLKGSSASMGALCLADLARQLEERGREGSLEGASDLLEALERELARVGEALAKLRN